MLISQAEFLEWKSHPVTEKFFTEVELNIAEATEQLVQNVDSEAIPDDYLRGHIRALRSVLQIELSEDTE